MDVSKHIFKEIRESQTDKCQPPKMSRAGEAALSFILNVHDNLLIGMNLFAIKPNVKLTVRKLLQGRDLEGFGFAA